MLKKYERTVVVFSLYYLLPDLLCYILLHSFHISINVSVSFLLASGPELQAVRFGYVILGENVKKGLILEVLQETKLHCRCLSVFVETYS